MRMRMLVRVLVLKTSEPVIRFVRKFGYIQSESIFPLQILGACCGDQDG